MAINYQLPTAAPHESTFNLLGGLSSYNESRTDSSGKPIVMDTKQSDWLHSLSQMIGALAAQQYQWGLDQYSKLDTLTDQQIDNFLRLGDVGAQQAQGLAGRYEDVYAPQADAYANEAQTYASPQRMMHEMGRAQAGAMQAGKQALDNAERDLEAFGIDPSSGRYQDLVRASHTANAAAAAAAGEVERARVEQEGARRREVAMNYGAQLPSQSVNALNSAMQGVSGAVNAGLGRANAGVALTGSAHPYYSDAMSLKYPPVGQNTVSESRGSGGSINSGGSGGGGSRSSPSRPSSSGGARSGTPGGIGGGGGQSGSSPTNLPGMTQPGMQVRGFNPKIQSVDPYERDAEIQPYWPNYVVGPDGSTLGSKIPDLPSGMWEGIQGDHDWSWNPSARIPLHSNLVNDPFGNSSWADPNYNQTSAWNDVPLPSAFDPMQGMSDPYAAYNDYLGGNMSDPYGGNTWDTGDQYLDASQGSNWGDTFNDYYGTGAGQNDYWTGEQGGSQGYGSWDQWQAPTNDWYSPSYGSDYGGSTSGWDTPAPTYSNEGWPSPISYADSSGGGGGDYWGGSDWSDYGGDSYAYAGGGAVHPQMSPSGGQQIDDVPAVVAQTGQRAQLNADEFVIPRDVAIWKGQEFFQNLIKKSREARVGAPAKPSKTRPSGQNPGMGNA